MNNSFSFLVVVVVHLCCVKTLSFESTEPIGFYQVLIVSDVFPPEYVQTSKNNNNNNVTRSVVLQTCIV